MDKRSFNRIGWILFVLASLGFAWAAPAAAQEGTPISSGHVTMRIGRGAMIISATGGSGVLSYQGETRNFKIGGMGLGLLGFTSVEAEGEVYGLKNIEDFSGAYVQGSADWAAGSGEGMLWLTNTKGVVIKLRSKTKGVSLAVGGEGLMIQMDHGAK